MGEVLLEVTTLHERDVPGAHEGGADRLHLVALGTGPDAFASSPTPALVSAVCRASDVPVFVLLRLNDSWTTTGGELTRLLGLAGDYLGAGAAGLSWGFLDQRLEVDDELCRHLADGLPGVPWTFHDAFDHALDPARAWDRVRDLPRLAAVRSAGSPRGMDVGGDDLLTTAQSDPALARLLLAGGGLVAEQVPWLLRAGVRQFHLGVQARPGASYKSYVEAGHVRSWRRLLDDSRQRL